MSHRNVERVIGRIVTDEAFRRRFSQDPSAVLREVVDGGVDLTACEVQALFAMDARLVAQFAEALDPRIQKSDLCGSSLSGGLEP